MNYKLTISTVNGARYEYDCMDVCIDIHEGTVTTALRPLSDESASELGVWARLLDDAIKDRPTFAKDVKREVIIEGQGMTTYLHQCYISSLTTVDDYSEAVFRYDYKVLN